MTALYLLPFIAGLLLLVILRNDRRHRVIAARLSTIRSSEPETTPNVSLAKLRRAASHSISVTMLLPNQIRTYLDRAFEATGNRVGVVHLLIAALVAAIISYVFASKIILALDPISVIAITIAATGLAPFIVLRMAQGRYRNRFLNVFPDALDLIGRAVKAGLPVNEALLLAGTEIADPVGNEIRRTTEQVQLGVPMIDALEKTADRVRIPDFQFMVVALALQAKTGGSLAETLTNLSRVIRSRKGLRLKVRGLTAEAKVSALVLAALPFAVGGLMFAMNRDLLMPLFVDPRGRFMVGVASLSLVSGLIMMYVMIKRAVR